MEGGKRLEGNLQLHEDLVFYEILSKLPPKSLMRFKSVSKTWLTRISGDSSFIDAHLAQQTKTEPRSIFDGQSHNRDQMVIMISDKKSKAAEVDMSYVYTRNTSIDIVGSCIGLVCLFQSSPTQEVMLWNPATHHLRLLPCSLHYWETFFGSWGIGFGFDDASNDYKVVQLMRREKSAEEDQYFLCAYVFAKSGAVWRGCGVSGISEIPYDQKSAVAVEGALHWVVRSYLESPCRVVSFDLRDEVLRLADAPVDDNGDIRVVLCNWRGSLAAFTYSDTDLLMWESSTSAGGVRRWRKKMKFRQAMGEDEWGRCVWRDQFLAVRKEHLRCYWRLVVVDPEPPHHETVLELPDNCRIPCGAFDYIETILSVF